jgi:hypothetical protein
LGRAFLAEVQLLLAAAAYSWFASFAGLWFKFQCKLVCLVLCVVFVIVM